MNAKAVYVQKNNNIKLFILGNQKSFYGFLIVNVITFYCNV